MYMDANYVAIVFMLNLVSVQVCTIRCKGIVRLEHHG